MNYPSVTILVRSRFRKYLQKQVYFVRMMSIQVVIINTLDNILFYQISSLNIPRIRKYTFIDIAVNY